MRKILIALLCGVASLCAAQQPATIKLSQLETAKVVESSRAGQIGLTNSDGKQRYAQYTEIDLVPIAFTPTATGNTSNYSEFVTDPLGDIYYIDWQGRGLRIDAPGTDKNGYYGGNGGNGGDATIPSVTRSTLTNQLTFYKASDDAGGFVPVRVQIDAGNETDFMSFRQGTDSLLISRSDQEFAFTSTKGMILSAADIMGILADSVQVSNIPNNFVGERTFLTVSPNNTITKQEGIGAEDLNYDPDTNPWKASDGTTRIDGYSTTIYHEGTTVVGTNNTPVARFTVRRSGSETNIVDFQNSSGASRARLADDRATYGCGATNTGAYSLAIGHGCEAQQAHNTAIGHEAVAGENSGANECVALGRYVLARRYRSCAIGGFINNSDATLSVENMLIGYNPGVHSLLTPAISKTVGIGHYSAKPSAHFSGYSTLITSTAVITGTNLACPTAGLKVGEGLYIFRTTGEWLTIAAIVDANNLTLSATPTNSGSNTSVYYNGNNFMFQVGNGIDDHDWMVLDELGNLGLNTNAPSQRLHVAGNLRVTGAVYDSNNDPGTSGQVLSSTVTGTDWVDAGGGGSQSGIQPQDEGSNLGTSGTMNTLDFVGAGVTASRVGDVVTVTVPGGGAGDISNGGNAFAAPIVIGSNDNQSVSFETNGVTRLAIASGATTGGAATHDIVTASTATADDVLTIRASSTGVPAASFGSSILFQGESSTTANRDMIRLRASWATATDASRSSQLIFQGVGGGGGITDMLTISRQSGITTLASPSSTPLTLITTSSSNPISLVASGSSSNIEFQAGNVTNSGGSVVFLPGSYAATSGAKTVLSVPTTFAPTSGTGTFLAASITPTINQTGGANGATTGLLISPTLTSAPNWTGLQVAGSGVAINQSSAAATSKFVGSCLFGSSSSPTAKVHIAAGSATATTAPLKIDEGANMTTPEDGAVEHTADNLHFTAGTTRYTLAKTLTNTATLDFGSTAAQGASDLTITVTGAASGDAVTVGAPSGSVPSNGTFFGWVSAANTVTVRYANNSSGALDPASGTFRVSVIKY